MTRNKKFAKYTVCNGKSRMVRTFILDCFQKNQITKFLENWGKKMLFWDTLCPPINRNKSSKKIACFFLPVIFSKFMQNKYNMTLDPQYRQLKGFSFNDLLDTLINLTKRINGRIGISNFFHNHFQRAKISLNQIYYLQYQ